MKNGRRRRNSEIRITRKRDDERRLKMKIRGKMLKVDKKGNENRKEEEKEET